MCEYRGVGAGVSVFWVVEGGWTPFGGAWGWVEVYLGWVEVGGHFLLVGGGGWRWVEVYFGWM